MKYSYTPQGVCSREMKIEVEGDTIQFIKIIGGCDGNTKGLCNLLKGMKVDEAIQKQLIVEEKVLHVQTN